MKEGKIFEADSAEDKMRDLYHQVKCEMESNDDNVSVAISPAYYLFILILPDFLVEQTDVFLPLEGELYV